MADLNNCYFADPSINVLSNLETDNTTGLAEFNSNDHRKIRSGPGPLALHMAATCSGAAHR